MKCRSHLCRLVLLVHQLRFLSAIRLIAIIELEFQQLADLLLLAGRLELKFVP